MSSNDPRFQIETTGERYRRKLEENPFVAGGIVGLIAALAYGAYSFKHRGKMSTSMFLMQLRVSAQGMVVGSLGLGMMYETCKLLYKQSHESAE